MNKLSREARAQILGMMVEGMALRAIARTIGASKNTIAKLLADAGEAFSDYQDRTMRGLACKRLRVDEIWSFVYAKQKNVAGDIWTWSAIDADTKLIPSWYVGARDSDVAQHFIGDLAARLADRVHLTSDGHKPYLEAVEQSYAVDIDYTMLVKIYGEPARAKTRYSPGECIGAEQHRVERKPDPAHFSTSYIERANLSRRIGMRRFTRLSDASSKKAENHCDALAIYFMHYNFVRIHQTLRCSPAMAAGVSATLGGLVDMVVVLEEWEKSQRHKSY